MICKICTCNKLFLRGLVKPPLVEQKCRMILFLGGTHKHFLAEFCILRAKPGKMMHYSDKICLESCSRCLIMQEADRFCLKCTKFGRFLQKMHESLTTVTINVFKLTSFQKVICRPWKWPRNSCCLCSAWWPWFVCCFCFCVRAQCSCTANRLPATSTQTSTASSCHPGTTIQALCTAPSRPMRHPITRCTTRQVRKFSFFSLHFFLPKTRVTLRTEIRMLVCNGNDGPVFKEAILWLNDWQL